MSLWPVTPLGLLSAFEPAVLEWTSACGAGVGPAYLKVFFTTCALETPFYVAALRGLPLKRALFLVAACNLATHPVVYFLLPCLLRRYLAAVLIGEGLAIAVEAWVLRARGGLSWPPALAWSAAANLFSWQVGSLL